MAVDVAMTVLLLLLMARQITGESAHEWLGAGMFVLWIAHHALCRNWYGRLRKGTYPPARVAQIAVNTAVLLCMLGLMVSGIVLSEEVFAALPISGGIAWARTLHICCAFWGFVCMALHLGLHWNMVLGMARKVFAVPAGRTRVALRYVAVLIAGYGVYAFIKHQFLSYMLLRVHFVFFDFEQPAALFFADYMAIMGLFVFLAHYASKGLRALSRG